MSRPRRQRALRVAAQRQHRLAAEPDLRLRCQRQRRLAHGQPQQQQDDRLLVRPSGSADRRRVGLFSESYAYNAIGTFQSKGGVSYQYPSSGNPRPHAPTAVGGNAYSYDNNRNLTAAEGRTYTYDVENRLTQVHEGGSQLRSFAYDGDEALRSRADSGSTVMHYVTPDYQVNPSTGEATVFYRFGGRTVARRTNSGLLYVLADHLSSTQAEVQPNQSEAGQRRNYPFGTDRPVSGASDIINDERYTSQKRMEAGNGNPKRELYHCGARWYLPGVGVFTQPDSIVPEPKNPQALNRYSYTLTTR